MTRCETEELSVTKLDFLIWNVNVFVHVLSAGPYWMSFSVCVPLCVCFWPVSTLQCASTHRESSHISKQWGRSDSDQGAPCIYLCNYHCLFLLVCLSVCLFSSSFIMQPSSPSLLLLSTIWTPFCPYILFVYLCHHSLTSPSTLHSFILSYCYHWLVANCYRTAGSAPCDSDCKLSVSLCLCLSFKKPVTYDSKSLCLCLTFFFSSHSLRLQIVVLNNITGTV